jgi:hypothetical protein
MGEKRPFAAMHPILLTYLLRRSEPVQRLAELRFYTPEGFLLRPRLYLQVPYRAETPCIWQAIF